MFHLLKKDFIPHEANGHQPHILRWEALLAVLGLALGIEVFFLAQVFVLGPLGNIFSSILPSTLTSLTNLDRQKDNLSTLTVNPILQKAAELKAQDMAAKSYFAHTSPEGLTPWYWLEEAGYKFIVAGENLAINFVDSQDVENAWMNSPAHRANILNNNFTEIGIATAKGVYNGKETFFIAQFFGRPAAAAAIEQKEKEVEPIATPSFSLKPSPATTSPEIESQETFALVMGETKEAQETLIVSELPITPTAPQKEQLESYKSVLANKSAFLSQVQKILSEPHSMTNYLFIMLFTIILLALVLKIFVKIKIQYPALIANGLVALLVISSIMLINQFLSLYQVKIF
ncbi:MAG TPA: CAP domain-containing protein [Candidatus Portnoybacteria bacterium]|nr:CAP domain-containing protein [Candidatus Portnoybacteria bacterium]